MKIDLAWELELPEVVCDVGVRVCTLHFTNLQFGLHHVQGSQRQQQVA